MTPEAKAREIVLSHVPHEIKISHENLDWLEDIAGAIAAALKAKDAEHLHSCHDDCARPKCVAARTSAVPEHLIEALKVAASDGYNAVEKTRTARECLKKLGAGTV